MLSKQLLVLSTLWLSTMAYATNDHTVDRRIDQLMGAHTHQQYRTFFNQFKAAVIKHDKAKVAKLINYPMTAPVQGKDRVITNPEQFIALYDQIFTVSRQKLVAQQQYKNLFANSNGIMIGQQGEIWFSGICEDTRCQRFTVKVIRINS